MPACVGCGLFVNGSGVLEVQLRPGGGLFCDPDGPDAGLFLDPTVIGTDCITATGAGTVGSPLTIGIDISEDACNGLVCRGNGLYAPCPDSIIGSLNIGSTIDGVTPAVYPIALNTGGSATFDVYSLCSGTDTSTCVGGLGTSAIQVCNTLCCGVRGIWDAQAGGGFITSSSADFIADVSLEVSINGGAYGTSPSNKYRIQSFGVAGSSFYISNIEDVNLISLAVDECFSFSARVHVQVMAGTASWTVGPQFEFHWQINQVGCC